MRRCCWARSVSREHLRHQVALLDADAMLAGEHAADLDAKPQNVGAEFFGALEFVRIVRIEEDERMQIAVAGMKDIGDAQAVLPPTARACASSTSGSSLRGIVPSMQK